MFLQILFVFDRNLHLDWNLLRLLIIFFDLLIRNLIRFLQSHDQKVKISLTLHQFTCSQTLHCHTTQYLTSKSSSSRNKLHRFSHRKKSTNSIKTRINFHFYRLSLTAFINPFSNEFSCWISKDRSWRRKEKCKHQKILTISTNPMQIYSCKKNF